MTVNEDIDVLDKYFDQQEKMGASKERKKLIPIMAIMCTASLLIGAKLAASPQEQKAIPLQAEVVTSTLGYDFTMPLPELATNPLELPPPFEDWTVVQ